MNKWIVVLTVVFMLSLWCIDVSVTTMNLGGIMTNGFFSLSPSQTYHLGLYTTILSFVLMIFILIR